MIGICQGTDGVVLARVPEGTDGVVPRPASRRLGFVSSRFLRGRGPVRLSGAYLYGAVAFFGPEFLLFIQINGQA